MKCYCKSELEFENCCKPYIYTLKKPATPEQLMRSRYSAYVLQEADYLIQTTHISQRRHYKKKDVLEWSKTNTWLKLEVVQAEGAIVEFKAYYIDGTLQAQVHHEKSTFKQEKGIWYYVDGKFY